MVRVLKLHPMSTTKLFCSNEDVIKSKKCKNTFVTILVYLFFKFLDIKPNIRSQSIFNIRINKVSMKIEV